MYHKPGKREAYEAACDLVRVFVVTRDDVLTFLRDGIERGYLNAGLSDVDLASVVDRALAEVTQ